MNSCAARSGIALCATLCLAFLQGCNSGKKSRFDEIAGVDICQLITRAEADQILGPIEKTDSTQTSGSGIAGDCTWTFKSPGNEQSATLFVMMITKASSPHGPSPARFLSISLPELEASLGASPWAMEDLGDQAYLFQTRRPEHSELWMLQSNTLLSMRMMGGSSAQLESFARAMSRELEPKGD